MTRLFTIPGALGCFGFTLYFAWPEIRNALSWITRVLQGKKPTGVFIRRSLFSLGMASGAAVALFFLGSLYYQRSHETTLQGLYAQDFETAYKFGPSGPIPFQLGGKRYSIEAVIPFDTDSRSYFLSFYVPRSSASYEICVALSTQYMFPTRGPWRKFIYRGPGDVAGSASAGYTFTRQVYIYHEDGFTLKQQSDLTDLFQENGANLSLRGPEYLYTRQLIDRGKK